MLYSASTDQHYGSPVRISDVAVTEIRKARVKEQMFRWSRSEFYGSS
jgi:hypothetical protein